MVHGNFRGNAEIKEMAEEIEKNLAGLQLEKYDEEDGKYLAQLFDRQLGLHERV